MNMMLQNTDKIWRKKILWSRFTWQFEIIILTLEHFSYAFYKRNKACEILSKY